MRHQRPLCLVGLLLSWSTVVVSSSQLQSRDAALVIEAPAAGDTVVADSDSFFDIRWKNSTSSNVTISLRQGEPQNMTLIHVITPSTFNNGSYTWRADDDRFLAASSILDTTHSGCNYSMEFRVGGEIINSGYFTILTENDGGIPPNSTCPTGAITNSDSGNSGSPGAGGGSSGNSGSTVSTAALGGAVGGAAAGVLLIVGVLFFIAKKKGWIMSKAECERYITERLQSEESKQFLSHSADKDVHQADGGQVYQMP